jgi:two-component system sensor histidine kinase KdpD
MAAALLQFARSRNAGKLVIGQQEGGLRRCCAGRVARWRSASPQGGEIDLYTIARSRTRAADDRTADSAASAAEALLTRRRTRHLWAWPAVPSPPAGLRAGWQAAPGQRHHALPGGRDAGGDALWRAASALVSVLSVLSFDFFFVDPRFSITVSDAQYLLTLAVMLAVSLFISSLTAPAAPGQRGHAARGAGRQSLHAGQGTVGPADAGPDTEIGRRHLAAVFGARIAFFLPDSADQLRLAAPEQDSSGAMSCVDAGVAQWVYDNGQAAGKGTATLPSAAALYLPLTATATRGVLALPSTPPARKRPVAAAQLALPENRQMLEIFCSQIAMAIERLHYAEVAQDALVTMESERLRNSLLSAISHDLRTPLTSLVGSADVLAANAAWMRMPAPWRAPSANSRRRWSG